MNFVHKNEKVKIIIDTDFDNGNNMLILVHDIGLKKIHPLVLPEALLLPMELNVIEGMIEILEAIKSERFF